MTRASAEVTLLREVCCVRGWHRLSFVRVAIPDRATDPDGMVCTGAGCNDHFGANIVLTPQWTSYTILFGAMTQEGWGTQAVQFDAANAYGIEFEFPVQATFDCWIDDIAFVL